MRTGSWHPKLSTRTLRKRFPFSACNLRWVSQWLTLGRRACDGFILLESAITSTTVSEVVKFKCYQSGIPLGAVDQPFSLVNITSNSALHRTRRTASFTLPTAYRRACELAMEVKQVME